MLKVGDTFKNVNGKSYEVIAIKGEYMAVKDLKFEFNGMSEYVVALNVVKSPSEDGYFWDRGKYLYSIDAINRCLESK